jgi:prephenate dehydratase
LPIENSVEGAVGATLDLLVHEPGPLIRAELALPIRHHLLSAPGTKWEEIQRVASHPQALAQCARLLRDRLPRAARLSTSSTADAARIAATEHGTAAIASVAAAGRYGLDTLAADIQDEADNNTRFVLLSMEDAPPAAASKTSIAVVLGHRPGALHEALGVFAGAGINLTKVESRPSKRRLGEYLFFIDFEGQRADPRVAQVLEQLRERTLRFTFLGSYPAG